MLSVFADSCGEWLRNVKILHYVRQTPLFSKKRKNFAESCRWHHRFISRRRFLPSAHSSTFAPKNPARQAQANESLLTVLFRQKIPPAKREQKQKRAGSQRNQLQFLLQVGTCGRILSEKFTNMFRRLIPVIQLIKQFIFIDSGINVFAMLRHALAAMATSVAAVSASTFHFSVIFHFLRFFSLRQQSYNIFRYRPP